MSNASQDESRIVRAIEEAIAWANTGLTPNQAIQKVAEAQQLMPPVIARMVEGFNKSKTVYHLKTAAEADRAKPFELADTAQIVAAIYDRPAVVEKVAGQLPTADFSRLGLPVMEKVAAAPRPETIPVHSFAARLEKYAEFCRQVMTTLSFRVAEQRRNFDREIEKAAAELQRLTPPKLRKVAQMVRNGYPESGVKLMQVLRAYTRCDFPDLEKTAHGVIFPAEEPYLAIARVYDAAGRWVSACNAKLLLEKDAKEGAGLFRDFLAEEGEFGHVKQAAGRKRGSRGGKYRHGQWPGGGGGGGGGDGGGESWTNKFTAGYKSTHPSSKGGGGKGGALGVTATSKLMAPVYHSFLGSTLAASLADGEESSDISPLDVVEPSVFNRLRELEARRALMQLVLYDPDLNRYEMPELIKAYNQSVGSAPDAYKHPQVLKNLILQNIETGGVKDPFQLEQESTLAKNLAQTEKARQETEIGAS
jgi:uncharacterized coiled-coil protein SlyX